jgi:hypothetical protein
MSVFSRDNDILLIVGKSPERWDDVERFWDFDVSHDVCCINHTGIFYPCQFKIWFSYHSVELLEQLAPQNPWHGAHLFSTGPKTDGIMRWRIDNTRGSSSLNAARCAIRYWGYKRIVLAGVALTGQYYDSFYKHWVDAFPEITGMVKSMSGHTKDILGEPTNAWLNQSEGR